MGLEDRRVARKTVAEQYMNIVAMYQLIAISVDMLAQNGYSFDRQVNIRCRAGPTAWIRLQLVRGCYLAPTAKRCLLVRFIADDKQAEPPLHKAVSCDDEVKQEPGTSCSDKQAINNQ